MGAFITPVLLALLLLIVVLAVVRPVGSPGAPAVPDPFYTSFTEAYQTGDLLTGLLCAVIFVTAFRAKNVGRGAPTTAAISWAVLIAFIGLFVVYGGLLYLGATGSELVAPDQDRTVRLTRLVDLLGGGVVLSAFAVAVMLACLTTSVGLTAVVANYMRQISGGSIPQWAASAVVCGLGIYQALGGVERIIAIAGPIFMAIYPISIVMVILGLLRRWVPNDGVWKGSALLVLLVSLYDALVVTADLLNFEIPPVLGQVYALIPLAEQGFAWIVPALVGGVIGGFIWRGRDVNSRPEIVEMMRRRDGHVTT